MSPRGDDGQGTKGLGRQAPSIKGHHEFNPKDASTVIVGEESSYNLQKDDFVGITNDRISYMLNTNKNEFTFEESSRQTDPITSSIIQN